jgi:hypothetical protein
MVVRTTLNGPTETAMHSRTGSWTTLRILSTYFVCDPLPLPRISALREAWRKRMAGGPAAGGGMANTLTGLLA